MMPSSWVLGSASQQASTRPQPERRGRDYHERLESVAQALREHGKERQHELEQDQQHSKMPQTLSSRCRYHTASSGISVWVVLFALIYLPGRSSG